MKAWRLQASKINARRKAGSREPNARAQKVQRMAQPATKGMGNWLLVGLLMRAGIMPIGYNVPKKVQRMAQPATKGMRAGIMPIGYNVPKKVPPTASVTAWFKRWLSEARNLFS